MSEFIPSLDDRPQLPAVRGPLNAAVAASLMLSVGLQPVDHEMELRHAATAADTYAARQPIILVTDIPATERAYPEESFTSEIISTDIDLEASTESSTVYRYNDLTGLSFMRMSLPTAEAVQSADTVAELYEAARPYFADAGIDLYINDIPSYGGDSDEYVDVDSQDLESLKMMVTSIANAITETPREVLAYSQVRDLYLARAVRPDGVVQNNGGLAIFPNTDRPAAIAMFTGSTDKDWLQDVWHHEVGHHLSLQLNQQFRGGFAANYGQPNPDNLLYKDDLTNRYLWEHSQATTYQYTHDQSVAYEYGLENILEDEATSYKTLFTENRALFEVGILPDTMYSSDEGAPDPGDYTYGTPVGQKRVVWVEYLDTVVPGFKTYITGVFSLNRYYPEYIPYDMSQVRLISEVHLSSTD